jgi:UDP-3-O-acyl-N-acetylglucosamine deacetylase
VGFLEAVRAGHALHAALAQKLLDTPDAFSLVTYPQLPVLDRAAAPGGTDLEPAAS